MVGDHYYNDFIYLCKIVGDNREIKHNPDESSDFGFFGLEDLDNIKLFPNFKRLLKKVLST